MLKIVNLKYWMCIEQLFYQIKYGLEIFLAVYLSSDVQRSGKKCMPADKVYMFTLITNLVPCWVVI